MSKISVHLLSRTFIICSRIHPCVLGRYIIFLHYRSWWDQCKFALPAAAAATAPTTSEPPDFVKIIVFAQAILFLLFGVVQLVQFFMPHRRRAAEVAYILLSLTAKVLLGAILSANVLFFNEN